ncbi:3'-5' exonuclease [Leptospira langatensis]|uniref:3'-5' exonuclease n=1 Tax=Leptospira langatensis TaxID=2484983 RepID=A0A5R2ATV5_9LEPT|nr:3'-5' exonuclease [Leptospira langatensis]TGJ99889.1 3'-5' exonuclease [Leptospira langatensis]
MIRNVTCIDIETTGFSRTKDRIVEFAAYRVTEEAGVWRYADKIRKLVNPGISIPPEATAVHGITDEMVRVAPPFSEQADCFIPFLSDTILLGYNVKVFDIPFLTAEIERSGLRWPTAPLEVIDPFIIFKKREAPRHDLASAIRFYTGKERRRAHRAMIDVVDLLRVVKTQTMLYPEFRESPDPIVSLIKATGI